MLRSKSLLMFLGVFLLLFEDEEDPEISVNVEIGEFTTTLRLRIRLPEEETLQPIKPSTSGNNSSSRSELGST